MQWALTFKYLLRLSKIQIEKSPWTFGFVQEKKYNNLSKYLWNTLKKNLFVSFRRISLHTLFSVGCPEQDGILVYTESPEFVHNFKI